MRDSCAANRPTTCSFASTRRNCSPAVSTPCNRERSLHRKENIWHLHTLRLAVVVAVPSESSTSVELAVTVTWLASCSTSTALRETARHAHNSGSATQRNCVQQGANSCREVRCSSLESMRQGFRQTTQFRSNQLPPQTVT